jgi:hypothetical protein
MTLHLQQSYTSRAGKPAPCRLGRATCSRSTFGKKVFDSFRTRVCYAQGSATILVALAGMVPASHLAIHDLEDE